jgi:hypothetical protein
VDKFFGLLFAAAALTAAVVAGAQETSDKLPAGVAILQAEQGPMLLHQCSRSVPPADDFWTPSPQDVLEAEKALPHLMAHAKCHAPIHPLGEYMRQYVGITSGGRRMLYLNAVYSKIVARLPGSGQTNFDWQTTAIVVCDGGTSFWGVDYDVAAKSFGKLACNGKG